MDNACDEQLSKSFSNCLRFSRCKKRPVKNLKLSAIFQENFSRKKYFSRKDSSILRIRLSQLLVACNPAYEMLWS